MRLFHISPVPGLTVLEPRVPQYRLPDEPVEAVVCCAPSWWECAMLYPARRGLPEVLWLYEVVPEDLCRFERARGFLWASLEWRARVPIRVRCLGRLRMALDVVRGAFSRPCGNCGRPSSWCDDGAWCYSYVPPCEAEVVESV